MRIDKLIPTIAELRHDDVQGYLRGRGWVPVPDPREHVVVYTHASAGEVDVPLDSTLADYARRMGELVEHIAAVEQRSVLEVHSDLSMPPGDLLGFRVRSELVGSGTIPLVDGLRLREAQRNLILAAAHAAIQPQRYYPQLSRREPTALLAQCREAQTARGSYVMNLLVPVEPAIGKLPFTDPPGRRVTRLLMQTLNEIRHQLRSMDGEALLRMESRGMSANLLAALGEMYPPGEGSSLEISVRWARNRPPPEVPERLSFTEGVFPLLRAVADAMREQHPSPCELSGYVTRLERPGEGAEGPGTIVLVAQVGEPPAEVRVHVALPAPVYNEMAIPAHREGRRLHMTGTLRREGRKWILNDPARIDWVTEEEE